MEHRPQLQLPQQALEEQPNLVLHEVSMGKPHNTMIDPKPLFAFADANTTNTDAPSKVTPLNADNWAKNLPFTEHVQLFRSALWSSTLLGDLTRWPHALRLHVFTLFADSRPSCIYWGKDKIAIYNEKFVPLAGRSHPALMSQTFEEAFPEIWDTIQPVFDEAERSGVASVVNEQLLFVQRNGFVEETYFTGNFNPLRGDEGYIDGFYNSVHEITRQKITERRTAMLDPMSAPSVIQPHRQYILPFLEKNPHDIPMAMVYKVDKDSEPGRCLVLLCGSIGVPSGHPLAVEKADIVSLDGLIPLFREAHSEIITRPVDESFEGIEWKGFQEPSKFFSVIPIKEANCLFGFVVVGANPRRPIDEDHHQFMRDISIKVTSIAASVISAQEYLRHKERLQRELEASERQIRFFAEHASVGMQNLATDAKQVVWANEQFFKITGLPRQIEAVGHKLYFIDVVHPEDREKARETFKRVLSGAENVSAEIRLKRKFQPPFGEPEHACILSLSFPYKEDGKVTSVMTCVTDVSRLKWAERFEARKAEEAREAKRQTDEFIDIVSHEMRNPLSAIFQCADEIEKSMKACHTRGYSQEALLEALQSNVDAAHTISMCAKHQKTIVDDVLTLSKLEHTMLSISPEPITLKNLVERVMKMFETDLSSHNIKLDTQLKSPLQKNGIDWVQCDPSRVNQILVNLITNSIKFTKHEIKREISIRYGATMSDPRKMFPQDIAWAPNRRGMEDLTLEPKWGTGEHVYLCVQVSDTGVGMNKDEITKLFARFEQAGSKTMIKYGGSGLGLFISQRLTETQGGEIGVASVPNQGSTFAFYVKARQAEPEAVLLQMKLSKPGNRSRSNSKTLNQPNSIFTGEMHVLLVEDNLINQQILKKQLTKAGCVVHIANHGIEALKFLPETDIWHEKSEENKHLDIILMDWEMPEMDGLTCSRKIRQLQKEAKVVRHVQIIATTANARDEQVESALASGIDCVMSKPFIVADLLSKMRERLRHVGD